jgi:hypothetical protein
MSSMFAPYVGSHLFLLVIGAYCILGINTWGGETLQRGREKGGGILKKTQRPRKEKGKVPVKGSSKCNRGKMKANGSMSG